MGKLKLHYFNNFFIFLFLLFLPSQLGKHFFLNFSFINGVKIDYLSLIFYFTDLIAFILIILNLKQIASVFKKNSDRLILFSTLFFFNIIISKYPLLSFYHFLKIIELLSIFIIFKKNKLNYKILLVAFLLGGFFELILSLLQFYHKSSIQGIFYFFGERNLSSTLPDIATASINGIEFLRPYGTFSHPNSMAGFYLLLYFYFLISQPRELNISMLLKYSSLLIFSFLILISFSKTAIIVYLFLNVIYLIKKRDSCRFCPFSSGVIFFIVSAIFLQPAGDPFSLDKRSVLFFNSLNIISNNIFFGTGLGHYLYHQSLFPIKYNYFFLQPVHNIFLLFFAQTGLILGGLIIYHLYKFVKENLANSVFVFCFLAFFITGMLDHYWLTLQQNFLLLGVIFARIKR